MPLPRRRLLLLLPPLLLLAYFYHRPPPQIYSFGRGILDAELASLHAAPAAAPPELTGSIYPPGKVDGKGEGNYSVTVVVPRLKSEDVSWLDLVPGVKKAVYVVDAPEGEKLGRDEHRVLKNKGREAMAYLTYILDNYEVGFPDIVVFTHASRFAWHNNDALHGDVVEMLKLIRRRRVVREGYVNLRCQWYPGCPGWLRPVENAGGGGGDGGGEKGEEGYVAGAWGEMFPGERVPEVLGQACCAQFAVSGERLKMVERGRYEGIRDWLLKTELEDGVSGRVLEYAWQWVWRGVGVYCPGMHECYCDGYGLCWEDEGSFQKWFEMRYYVRRDEWELLAWGVIETGREEWLRMGEGRKAGSLPRPEKGKVEEVKKRVEDGWKWLDYEREKALKRGEDPRVRARMAGRVWREGDGF
ncbi:hypothetical protein EJ06DRAFT_511919 [Trichodelitschia bisporula]|uniref:Uncharacterized protein n=1 Tax=Trichodelitschia bisporula TaxID=703511 RepID=A0A6G1HV38_9PEZI|nr:hypothetical protein EJ06DRAFT_511919 [Trichodelitschia bisporula]